MRIKNITWYFVLVFVCMIGTQLECFAATDNKPPMPLSKNNMMKYALNGKAASDNVDLTKGSEIDKVILVFKAPLDKMGFSFDKTIRPLVKSIYVDKDAETKYPNDGDFWSFVRVLMTAYNAIAEKPEEALKKGLISQETYAIVNEAKTIEEKEKESEEARAAEEARKAAEEARKEEAVETARLEEQKKLIAAQEAKDLEVARIKKEDEEKQQKESYTEDGWAYMLQLEKDGYDKTKLHKAVARMLEINLKRTADKTFVASVVSSGFCQNCKN